MNWILLSLFAPLLWAFSNFVDKYVLGQHTKGIYDFVFLSAVCSAIFFPFLLFFVGIPELTLYSWLPILTGAILIYSYGFYGKALEQGDTSALVVLFKLIPVVTVILGFFFLGQSLSEREVLGFIIVLGGAMIVSFERQARFFTKGFGMILVAILMWSGMTLIADYALEKMSFWDFFLLDTLGSALVAPTLLIFPVMRKEVIDGIKTGTTAKYGWFSLNALLDFFGQMSIKKALALAPVAALVTVVMQVQSFYAIVIGVALTLFFPSVIKEDISPRNLSKKLLGALVMFSGVYILLT